MIINSAYGRGDYDYLYANYLGEGHDSLDDAVSRVVKSRIPDKALDLCAGTGHLTRYLVRQHVPHVIALDGSDAMLRQLRGKLLPLDHVYSSISTLWVDLNEPRAIPQVRSQIGEMDLVTCRQGVGYLKPKVLFQLPTLLRPGGTLLFNTFVKPSHKPWWRRRDDGIYEAGFFVFGRVVHLQARWPRVDMTHFYWHDIEGLFAPRWSNLGFHVIFSRRKRTLIVEVHRP